MSRRHTRIHTPIPTPEPGPPGGVDRSTHLLRLLHLASPALPIGAFHFSQGLEYAVDAGWVKDEAGALEWIGGIAGASLGTLDLPVLLRLLEAWTRDDEAELRRWNALLLACRETAELREEDRHLGASLLRVLREFGLSTEWFALAPRDRAEGVSHACAFAFACARWGIEAAPALQTFAWAWVENQVVGAVKLVPLGQSAGQRMLHALLDRIPPLVERARHFADSDIGISTGMSAVASGRHETQYTRLFRS
jgi:urease accessory protein